MILLVLLNRVFGIVCNCAEQRPECLDYCRMHTAKLINEAETAAMNASTGKQKSKLANEAETAMTNVSTNKPANEAENRTVSTDKHRNDRLTNSKNDGLTNENDDIKRSSLVDTTSNDSLVNSNAVPKDSADILKLQRNVQLNAKPGTGHVMEQKLHSSGRNVNGTPSGSNLVPRNGMSSLLDREGPKSNNLVTNSSNTLLDKESLKSSIPDKENLKNNNLVANGSDTFPEKENLKSSIPDREDLKNNNLMANNSNTLPDKEGLKNSNLNENANVIEAIPMVAPQNNNMMVKNDTSDGVGQLLSAAESKPQIVDVISASPAPPMIDVMPTNPVPVVDVIPASPMPPVINAVPVSPEPAIDGMPASPAPQIVDVSQPGIIKTNMPATAQAVNGSNRNNDILAQIISLVTNTQNPNTMAVPARNMNDGIDTEHGYLRNSGFGGGQTNIDPACKNDVSCMQIIDFLRNRHNNLKNTNKREQNSDPCLFYKLLQDYLKGVNFLSPDIKQELGRLKGKFVKIYRAELRSCLDAEDMTSRTPYSTQTRGILDGIIDFFKQSNDTGAERPGLLFDEMDNSRNRKQPHNMLKENKEMDISGNIDESGIDLTLTKYVTVDAGSYDAQNGKTVTKTVTVGSIRDSNSEIEKTVANKDISTKRRRNDHRKEMDEPSCSDDITSERASRDVTVTRTLTTSTVITITQKRTSSTGTSTESLHSSQSGSVFSSTRMHSSKESSYAPSSTARTGSAVSSNHFDILQSAKESSYAPSSTAKTESAVSSNHFDILSIFKKLDVNSYTTTTKGEDILQSIYSIIVEIKGKGKEQVMINSKSVPAPLDRLPSRSIHTITQTIERKRVQASSVDRHATDQSAQQNVLEEIRRDQKVLLRKIQALLPRMAYGDVNCTGSAREMKDMDRKMSVLRDSLAKDVSIDDRMSILNSLTKDVSIDSRTSVLNDLAKDASISNRMSALSNIAKDVSIEIIRETPSISIIGRTDNAVTALKTASIHSSFMASERETERDDTTQTSSASRTEMEYYHTITLDHRSSRDDGRDVKIKIEDVSDTGSEDNLVIMHGDVQ